jgi:uncharacterized membrane protein
MIFLSNQLPRDENGQIGRHPQNVKISDRNDQMESRAANSSSISNQMRSSSNSRQIKKNREKEKTVEILASLMAVFGILGILGGIGLLVFGIIGKELAGTISGAVLIVLGLLCFLVIGILLCNTSGKRNSQNTARRNTRVNP